MQRLEIEQNFALPVERVYAYLSEHENLGPLFGAKITRVRDGDTSRNGTGSVRRLRVGPLPAFEETVTSAIPNEQIDYRITRGSPLRGHHGSMSFSRRAAGSHLRYVLEFGAVVPGLDRLVRRTLQRSITRGLASVDSLA
jgi:uncharacterized protein YndB with AHSA1/START domain